MCGHPERESIDRALLDNEPYRAIADRTGTSRAALQRHRENHIPASLIRAVVVEAITAADDLLDRLVGYENRIGRMLDRVERAGDARTFFAGMREARACLALLAELRGELDRRPTLTLIASPEWLEVRGVILTALTPYPEARLAVAARLSQLDAGQ